MSKKYRSEKQREIVVSGVTALLRLAPHPEATISIETLKLLLAAYVELTDPPQEPGLDERY